MYSVLDSVKKGFSRYKKNPTGFIPPSGILFIFCVLISVILGAVRYFEPGCAGYDSEGLLSSYISRFVCDTLRFSFFIERLLFCVFGFVVTLFTLSIIRSLGKSQRGKVSGWTKHLVAELPNAFRVFLLELTVKSICIIPVVMFFLLVLLGLLLHSFINSAQSVSLSQYPGLLIFCLLFLIPLLSGALLYAVFTVIFTFLRIELVLRDKGMITAMKNSIILAFEHPVPIIMFHLLWLALSLPLLLLFLHVCCMGFLLKPFVTFFVFLPVRVLSEIYLWRVLCSKTKFI